MRLLLTVVVALVPQIAGAIPVNLVIVQTSAYPADVSPTALGNDFAVIAQRFAAFDLTGQFHPVGQVYGPYTVSETLLSPTTGCETNGISSTVVAQGGPPFFGPAGTMTIYVYPQGVGAFVCGYYGVSGGVTGGAGFAWAWAKKLGWGLGHALGLKIAGAEWCNTGKPCQYLFPYGHRGDVYDDLGSGGGLNAIERLKTNALKPSWIPVENQVSVSPTTTGTFPLAALDLPWDSQWRVLVITQTPPVYVEVRRDPTHTFVLLHQKYQGQGPNGSFNLAYIGTLLLDANLTDTTAQETVDWELSVGQCRMVSTTQICTTAISEGHATVVVNGGIIGEPPPPLPSPQDPPKSAPSQPGPCRKNCGL